VLSVVVPIAIRPRAESNETSGPSRFVELDRETQASALRALAAAATTYAVGYAVVFLSSWLISLAAVREFQLPPAFDAVIALGAIGCASFVAFRCRCDRCSSLAYCRLATIFLIVSSLGIAARSWRWESTFTNHAFEFGVSWLGVWIVMYASVVTLPPRQILVASLLAAATLPATATLSVLVHGTPAEFVGSPYIALARLATTVFICVGIGYACASRVFHLARSVSKAQRLGAYQLVRKIGAGGMGEVWTAKHRMLRRPAAVKLIRPDRAGANGDDGGATGLRRFEREAQATAMLSSPHSIVLYDFGTGDDGVFYYVMELLEGRDLKTLVQENGPVPAERAIHFLRAACDSLADAHHRGLIHRDVKPANLFTCRRGREFDVLKVLDFGLVRNVGESTDATTRFGGAGLTSGTPGFMAPEAILGDHAAGPRADIYGLGCVAYWLLTGQMVFSGTPVSVLVQHVKETPPAMSARSEIEVPPRLEAIVRACLAKDPDDRPGSAEELSVMLAEVAATLPPWTRERAEQWWRVNLPHLYAGSADGAFAAVESAALDP